MADEKSTKKKDATPNKSGTKKRSTKGVEAMNASPKKKAKDLAKREANHRKAHHHNEWMQPVTNPGDNAKYINHSLRLADLPLCPTDDEEAVRTRCQEYFRICNEDDMKPSVAGLALALGIDRKYLWEIREGIKGKNPRVADCLKKSMQLLELQMVDYMQNGQINPVAAIFLSKNHFGYRDQQEVVVSAQSALGDEKSAEEIRQRYIDSIADPGTIEGTAEEISEK